MKEMVRTIAVIFCLIGIPLHSSSQVDTLTILHVNDTHSMLAPTGPRTPSLQGTYGGIARASSVIGSTRMTDRNVLLLHAGDFSMGDLFYNVYFGAAELKILTRLGFDAMAMGNHEFDLTPSTLMRALDSGFAEGGFPLLSANLILNAPAVERLRSYIRPFVIKDVGPLRVGIFGLLAPETNVLSQPSPAIIDTAFVSVAMAIVDTLKSRHCSVIVCLSHLGIVDDERLASAVSGINVIVGGHDHYLFTKPKVVARGAEDTTWIVQANSAYLDIGKLKLTVAGGHVKVLQYNVIPLDLRVPEEPGVSNLVQRLISQIEERYGPVYTRQIAHSTGYFREVADSLMFPGFKDTPIGDLVTDAFRKLTGSQIALVGGGSTAQPLYPGPIVTADAFRVVGYGFNKDNGLGYHLVSFTMLGADLLKALEYGLSTIETRDEFLVQVSGLRYLYDSSHPPFSRLVDVHFGKRPIARNVKYSVTTNEYVSGFLKKMGIAFENLHLFGGDTTEAQVLADYISELHTIRPKIGGRIVNIVGTDMKTQPESTPPGHGRNQDYSSPSRDDRPE